MQKLFQESTVHTHVLKANHNAFYLAKDIDMRCIGFSKDPA